MDQNSLSEAQKADKFRNRRRMAWWSFTLIALVGVPMLFLGLWSSPVSERIETMSFFIGTLFGVWVSVVLAYFGASAVQDRTATKYGEPYAAPTAPQGPPSGYRVPLVYGTHTGPHTGPLTHVQPPPFASPSGGNATSTVTEK